MLGWEFLRQAPADWDILATLHRNQDLPPGVKLSTVLLDITSREQVCALVTEFRPQIIVHLSSLGDLDYCKAHPEEAWNVNVEGTRNMLECSQLFRPAFVFLSTMYVFDGTRPPYAEEAATHPIVDSLRHRPRRCDGRRVRTRLCADQRCDLECQRFRVRRPAVSHDC